MTPRPISLRDPQLARLNAGTLDCLRRPLGPMNAALRPGDRLWVREPYFLPARWDSFSPSAAERAGATPVFTDFDQLHRRGPGSDAEYFGKRRFARELLRVWHRQHLFVNGVTFEVLACITDDEIAAEGFSTRAAFAANWDANLAVSNASGNLWAENPVVRVLRFTRITAPLPQLPELTT